MKKTLLSLGTLSAIVAPVVSVIACGDGDVPGHEAPYSILIQADATTPTQANVFVDLKGFVSDSYIREIKSRIAESIAAANKDTLKYTTTKIWMGPPAWQVYTKWSWLINSSSLLTNTNKNNLEAIFNIIDTPLDDFFNRLKSSKDYSHFFKEDAWKNIHNQIDKVDKDEIKKTLLKYLGFASTNPNLIDFKYKMISDKLIDFTITRTNVVASPELDIRIFVDASTSNGTFIKGDVIHVVGILDNNLVFPNEKFDIAYITKSTYDNGSNSETRSTTITYPVSSPQNIHVQLYKVVKYLLKANGYNNELELKIDENFGYSMGNSSPFNQLKRLGNSASKIFAKGTTGASSGISSDVLQCNFSVDFDKKTFKMKFTSKDFTSKQWIFGKDGDYLVMDPSHEWSITLEGTYELTSAANEVQSITALTKAIATDGSKTINILESSSGSIVKATFDYFNFFR